MWQPAVPFEKSSYPLCLCEVVDWAVVLSAFDDVCCALVLTFPTKYARFIWLTCTPSTSPCSASDAAAAKAASDTLRQAAERKLELAREVITLLQRRAFSVLFRRNRCVLVFVLVHVTCVVCMVSSHACVVLSSYYLGHIYFSWQGGILPSTLLL